MRKKESNRRETNIRWKIKSYDVNKKQQTQQTQQALPAFHQL